MTLKTRVARYFRMPEASHNVVTSKAKVIVECYGIYAHGPNKAETHRPPILPYPPIWSHRLPSSSTICLVGLAMAPHTDDVPKAQSVITEAYGELEILVPEAFREYSTQQSFSRTKNALLISVQS